MKALWIKNDIVENASVWSEESSAPEGYEIVLVDDDYSAGPGFKRVNGEFVAPEPVQAPQDPVV